MSLSPGKKRPSLLQKMLQHLFEIEPIQEYSDEIWRFCVPLIGKNKKWICQSLVKYQEVIYWTIQNERQLEIDLKTGQLNPKSDAWVSSPNDLTAIIRSNIAAFKSVQKDWLGYHQKILRVLPKKYRFGLIQRRMLWDILPDMIRPDLELNKKEYGLLMAVFSLQDRSPETLTLPRISLKTYLEYCRIAYLANLRQYKERITTAMSGMEMYKAMNTTHIDLGVYHENHKWFIFLSGNSTGRMLETSRMALAFHQNKMPFRWMEFKEVKDKMQGTDPVGIIPEYNSLHRAYQLFDVKDRVFDCIHWDDLGSYKTKARPLIYWLPLEPLYPRSQRIQSKLQQGTGRRGDFKTK